MILRVKLKRKLCYKGYYEYQFVNTNSVQAALEHLKTKNKWYSSVILKDFKDDTANNTFTENMQHFEIQRHAQRNDEVLFSINNSAQHIVQEIEIDNTTGVTESEKEQKE